MNLKAIFAIMMGLLLTGCEAVQSNQNTAPEVEEPIAHTERSCLRITQNTTLNIEGFEVDIRVPSGEVKADLLILPGWSFSRTDWCEKASLCEQALSKGYRLILPEMGKSIYASTIYPETRKDWQKFPTGEWVTNSLIPTLSKAHCILDRGEANFVMGLSTGARGAVLTALRMPDYFWGCGALSGDYDQTLLPKDNLMRGWYGEYEQFPERWQGDDNPVWGVYEFNTPIYLGHGMEDKVVPVNQTRHFHRMLDKQKPDLKIGLNLPANAGHDYAYWDSETENVLNFFQGQLKTRP